MTPYLDRLAGWDRGTATVRPRARARFEPPTGRPTPSGPGVLDTEVDAAGHPVDPLAAENDDTPAVTRPPNGRRSRFTPTAPVPPVDRTAGPTPAPHADLPEVDGTADGPPPTHGGRGQAPGDVQRAVTAPEAPWATADPAWPSNRADSLPPSTTTDPTRPSGRAGDLPPTTADRASPSGRAGLQPAETADPARRSSRAVGLLTATAGSAAAHRHGGLQPAETAGAASPSDRGGGPPSAAAGSSAALVRYAWRASTTDPAGRPVLPDGPPTAAAAEAGLPPTTAPGAPPPADDRARSAGEPLPSPVDLPLPATRLGDGRAAPEARTEPAVRASPTRRAATAPGPPAPVVHVQIDRIVVRVRDEAPTPPAAATRRPDLPRPSRLADYLDARVRRAR